MVAPDGQGPSRGSVRLDEEMASTPEGAWQPSPEGNNAINADVLMEMDVPEAYMETLPKVIHKNTRALLYNNYIYLAFLHYHDLT